MEATHAFVLAGTVKPDSWHKSGTLDAAVELLARFPSLPQSDLLCALVYGEVSVVSEAIEELPGLVNKKIGPRKWEPLLYVCFSAFFRLNPARRTAFEDCVRLLLAAGADPNAHFWNQHEKETALYGAIGLANSPGVGRMLIQAGASLDDDEVVYHGAEFAGVAALEMVAREFGIPEYHAPTALMRKLDYDDLPGLRKLLAAGLDPNAHGRWDKNALHQALLRFRSLPFFELLIEFGADPDKAFSDGQTAYQRAARMGRTDVLPVMEKAGANTALSVKDQFLAACARADRSAAQKLLEANPSLMEELDPKEDLRLLVDCAQRNQRESVALMMDLGFPLDAKDEQGFTALLIACWNGYVDLIDDLLQRRAPLEILNNYGGTVLDATVWGFVHHPDPDKPMEFILQRLIDAGARLESISPYPTGDPRIDGFLSQYL